MKSKTTRRRFLALVGSTLASSHIQHAFASAGTVPSLQRSHTLWFSKPAGQWADALPLGNGRLGAMVFGGYSTERIALNEDTLWSAAPKDWNNPTAIQHLPVVRRLVLEQMDYAAADQELRKMQGPFNEAFQPLGDLLIKFDHGDDVINYRRELDLDRGLSRVIYEAGGVRYTREGAVSGLRCRGGLEVSMRWSGGSPKHIDILALRDGTHTLRAPGGSKFANASTTAGKAVAFGPSGRPGTVMLSVSSGQQYMLTVS